jgi:hypothetical protein
MGKPKPDEDDDTTAAASDDKRGDNETDESNSDADNLKPAETKIGEEKDNLRKRSDWFQRRR